ncbi:bifunctional oligoribonuclease/PAP phosphatase NrnA [Geobacter sp. AOG1]|uniref:DHH family phosphoesterase n=1 Tax=Geobacter sp. AOG1 TaxID=1566346 RepID=UPI001CC4B804|nr:DHH family phosphoesterase [Geobacter sp. AOG1]GFE58771.1 DHH family phosphoesterase [Geobacter sp. AOG1]
MPTADERSGTRLFTDNLLAWVRGKGKIVIVVHDNPDPDCLASAMALRHLFVMKLNREALITFSGMIGRSENLAMAKELQIPLTPLGITDLSEFQVICMLDTQPGTGNNSLPSGTRVDIVIDHHPLRDATRQCRWVDVREEYGVTATILYEYLQVQDVPIGTKLATALFYAIKSETQDLGREANHPDREAYHRLFPLTNKRLLNTITHPKQPIEYFATVSAALTSTLICGNGLVSRLGSVAFPELVAEMADFMLRLEDIEMVLAMGMYNNEMIISMRSNRYDMNAGDVLRQLVAGFGAAGGHGMMAGGKVEIAFPTPAAIEEMEELLTKRFLAELGVASLPVRHLIT